MPLPTLTLLGSEAPKTLEDFLYEAIFERLIAEGLAFDGIDPPALEADREGKFALLIGSENAERWMGGDVAVLTPASGTLGEGPAGDGIFAFHTATDERQAIGALWWGISLTCWGAEPGPLVLGIQRQFVKMKRARAIFDNVARVVRLNATAASFRWVSLDGFGQDTAVLRYGDALTVAFAISVTFYNYPRAYIPVPQKLVPALGHPIVANPGDPP